MDELESTEEIVESVEPVSEEVSHEETSDATDMEASASEETEEVSEEVPETEGEEEEAAPVDPGLYKFKAGVFNKDTKEFMQEDREIDKRFHGLMNDPESAKVVRELHEKAAGLDTVKERLIETRGNLEQVASERDGYKDGFASLRSAYQGALKSGNLHKLDHFFEMLNVDKDVIFNYALEKAKLQEMPPEQRRAIEAQMESDRRAEASTGRATETERRMQQQAYQLKMVGLDVTLSAPEIKSYADAFDAQVGRPGAFKNAVIQHGNLAWFQQNKDLSPQEAAQEVIKSFGLKPQASQAQKVTQPGQKRVVPSTIPNIQSRGGGSPVSKKKFKSIEDLKKYSQEKFGS